MYEIWLATNIVWEIALDVWPWVLALGLLVAMPWLLALSGRPAGWRAAVRGAVVAAAMAAAATVALLPLWSRSSLAELAYWVDWANLAAIAAGAAAVAFAIVWPALARWRRPA
jgi:hypothetical protein